MMRIRFFAAFVLCAVGLAPAGAQAQEEQAASSPASALVVRDAKAGIPHPLPPRRPVTGRSHAPVFHAIDMRDWPRAYALASQSGDPVLTKLVSWVRFTTRGERMDFDEVAAFIDANPDWPQMGDLIENAEYAINERVPDSRILAWFGKHPPVSTKGALSHAEALLRKGETARAHALVRATWIGRNFDGAMEKTFYNRFRRVLTSRDHEQRIDRLLWDGRSIEARNMLRRIKSDYSHVAVARMRLRAFEGGVDWALRRVPAELENDPGLVYERLRWRRRKDRDDEAIAMIWKLPAELARPGLVWREQGILARRELRKGNVSVAYRLASRHRQKEGEGFADAEFLSGFIALRFLKEPRSALVHFTRLHEGVNFPVSKARGAYWAGRAAQDSGDTALARQWFERAAANVTTFYGQLAAAVIDQRSGGRAMPALPAVNEEEASAYARRDVVRAAGLAAQSLERGHLKSFVRHLAKIARSPAEHVLASAIAIEAGRADVAVWAAKDSLKDGVHLIETGWPRRPLPENRRGLEGGIVLGLMRQESAFNPEAVSWAGARGLMQVMPATASAVAKGIGLPFSRERLLTDPIYNMTIGTAYFSQVLSEFSGSYALALAAYNAGPGRVRRWMRSNGDFRKGEIDAIDWIELIPVSETRDYVQRVLENVQVYRALLDGGRLRALHPASIKG